MMPAGRWELDPPRRPAFALLRKRAAYFALPSSHPANVVLWNLQIEDSTANQACVGTSSAIQK